MQDLCRLGSTLVPIVAVLAAQGVTAVAEPPVRSGDAEAARQVLRDRGLMPSGRHWLCAAESRLYGRLDSLDRLQKQLRQAQKFVDERVAANDETRRQLAQVTQALAARRAQRIEAGDAAARKQLAEDLARLSAQQAALTARYLPPTRFAEEPQVREAVVEWTSARNALAVTALGYSQMLYEMQSEYARLREDHHVQRALNTLAGEATLGSGRNLAPYRRRLDEARRAAIAPAVPLYRVSGQWRTSLLLGDTQAAACRFVDGPGPTLLPESLVRSAGIVVPQGAPTLVHAVGDGRHLSVRVMRLPQVRLGSHVLRDVEAYVLPPEGEDLGAQISRQTFGAARVRLEPERVRLAIEPPSN